jgi:tubby and related proteins
VIGFDWDNMGPGRMRAAIPRVKRGNVPLVFRARVAKDSLAAAAASKDEASIMMLKNKRPQWNDEVQGHVLDFKGRVTMSSIKNFQLGSDETGDETLLQFGRVEKDKFTMDFQHPLSYVQALGIVMAALDPKFADRKAFKGLTGKGALEDDGAWFAHWDTKEK